MSSSLTVLHLNTSTPGEDIPISARTREFFSVVSVGQHLDIFLPPNQEAAERLAQAFREALRGKTESDSAPAVPDIPACPNCGEFGGEPMQIRGGDWEGGEPPNRRYVENVAIGCTLCTDESGRLKQPEPITTTVLIPAPLGDIDDGFPF